MAAYRYLRWGGVDPRRERIMVPQSSKIDGLGQKHLGRFWPEADIYLSGQIGMLLADLPAVSKHAIIV
jgi:hypothetical protein